MWKRVFLGRVHVSAEFRAFGHFLAVVGVAWDRERQEALLRAEGPACLSKKGFASKQLCCLLGEAPELSITRLIKFENHPQLIKVP